MPVEHAVGVEPLEPERLGGRLQRRARRHSRRVERTRNPVRDRRLRDARGREEPDELSRPHARSPRLRLEHDPLDENVWRRRVDVDDVRRDLHDAAPELEPERLDPRQPVRGLAHGRSDIAGGLERPEKLDVEGDEQGTNADEDGPGPCVEQPRTVRGLELAGVHTPLELRWAAPAVEDRSASVADRAVEEDGHSELVPDPAAHGVRDGRSAQRVGRRQRDDGNDVRRTDARMDAVVATQIDAAPSLGDPRDEAGFELLIVTDERHDRAMVIGVEMRVEHARAGARERARDRRDRRSVTALRHVRHRLERQHAPTLRRVREPTAPEYYDRRAPEYDDWYLGTGLYAGVVRPGFEQERREVEATLASLSPASTVDVACGTGFLTRHLRGAVTGLDQSRRMLDVAARSAPNATLVEGDALALPFDDDAFERVVTGHFYGHLDETQRGLFLREARRVAAELVIVDASDRASEVAETWSTRVLRDGSTWEVFKRWFSADALLAELGGGEVLHDGTWFVVVRSPR